MGNEFDNLKKTISIASNNIAISNEQKRIQTEQRQKNTIVEFNEICKNNEANLIATGIVEIFEKIIQKEIVTRKPNEPAFITWSEQPIYGKTPMGKDYTGRSYLACSVYLNFDSCGHELGDGEGVSEGPKKLEASYADEEFKVGTNKKNLRNIGKKDLIKIVGQEIIKLKEQGDRLL